ncbi:MAG: hypothetical protein RLZZ432_670 [Chloroflexota bacterium]
MSVARRALAPLLAAALGVVATAAAPRGLAVSTIYVGPGGGSGGCAAPAHATIDGAIAAATSGDTIHVCAGTYTQATSYLTGTLRIEGDGIGQTIVESDGSTNRAFTIPGDASNVITIADLTIRDITTDDVGAGIYAGGASTLTVERVRFSVLETNGFAGGALFADGVTLTIRDSQFVGNRANGDAAVHCQDVCDVEVSGTLFTDNVATSNPASALFVYDGTVEVWNSTFINNTGPEMQLAISSAVLRNVTMLSQGSGILITPGEGSVEIHESIIAGRESPMAPPATWHGANLASHPADGASLHATWAQIVGGETPAITTVGDTQVFALFDGHPAAGAGDNAECAAAPVSGVDQTGAARPQGADCDLGAYETAYVAAALPPTSAPSSPLVDALTVALLALAALVAAEGALRGVGTTLRG